MSTPVVIDGRADIHLGNGGLECILETGESHWRSEPLGATYWSMAGQGNKILSLASNGTLHLVQANPRAFTLASLDSVAYYSR